MSLQTICGDCRKPLRLRVDGPKNATGISICDSCAGPVRIDPDLRQRAREDQIKEWLETEARMLEEHGSHATLEIARRLRTLWPEIEAALRSVQEARDKAAAFDRELLESIMRDKAPCGHWSSHCYSPDGKGREILCLDCEVAVLKQQVKTVQEETREQVEKLQGYALKDERYDGVGNIDIEPVDGGWLVSRDDVLAILRGPQ